MLLNSTTTQWNIIVFSVKSLNSASNISIVTLFYSPLPTTPIIMGFPAWVAQMVKNLPKAQETWIRSLAWKDPLEEGMATHSSILVWRIPMDRGAWWATIHGLQRVGDNWEIQHSIHSVTNQIFIFRRIFLKIRACCLCQWLLYLKIFISK